MKRKQINTKKRNTIAVSLALVILLSGTLAWQSFDQVAMNETRGDLVKYGARLHDDFNGENKDIYVENYFTQEEGGAPVYARIRLDEYMEYGDGAGVMEEDKDRSEDIVILSGDLAKLDTESVEITPIITDRSTWHTFLYTDDYQAPEQEEIIIVNEEMEQEETIRTYRNLEFGGTTIYMPTFNKNSRSDQGEANGTMHGGGEDRFTVSQYTDYYVYKKDEVKTAVASYYWNGKSEIPTYYNAEGTETLKVDEGANYYNVNNVVHMAKETVAYDNKPQSVSFDVITMLEWLNLQPEDQQGDYWVYDTDGWAYWANHIQPDTATNLLLTGIESLSNPDASEIYYAINVVSEFASIDDIGNKDGLNTEELGMYGDITENGIALLDRITLQ